MLLMFGLFCFCWLCLFTCCLCCMFSVCLPRLLTCWLCVWWCCLVVCVYLVVFVLGRFLWLLRLCFIVCLGCIYCNSVAFIYVAHFDHFYLLWLFAFNFEGFRGCCFWWCLFLFVGLGFVLRFGLVVLWCSFSLLWRLLVWFIWLFVGLRVCF